MSEIKTSKPKSITFKSEWKATPKEDQKPFSRFYFSIEWENGDTGQFFSNRSDQDMFIIGKEADYTTKIKSGQYGDYKEFYSTEKKAESKGLYKPNKSTFNDPLNVSKMALGLAQDYSTQMHIVLVSITRDPINLDLRDKDAARFHKWIIKDGLDRDICNRRWYAIGTAVKLMGTSIEIEDNDGPTIIDVNSPDVVISVAEHDMKKINSITI